MAATREDILKAQTQAKSKPVVTQQVKQAVEGTTPSTQQAQELASVNKRAVMNQPVVTDNVKQAVNNTMVAPPTADKVKSAVEGAQVPYGFVDEYLAKMQPTAAELEAEQKREKRKAIFNAIGDGVSALANLYFTTKGAPNSYNPEQNMTAAQRKRYEQLLADRKADEEKYYNAKLKLEQLRENANWRKQQRLDQINQYNQTNERLREQAQATEDRLFEQFQQKLAAEVAKSEATQADKVAKNTIREKELEEKNRHNTAAEAETVRYHDQLVERSNNRSSGSTQKKRGVASWAGKGTKDNNKIEF